MRVLITGGTGFIGRALCRALTTAGTEVWVYSRRPERVSALCGEGVHPLTSLARLPTALVFDAAINLAGESIAGARWSDSRKRRLRDSRIAVTEQPTSGFAQHPRPPAVLLSGSAVGYYGNTGDRIVEESAPAGADFGARLCADWEAAAKPAAALGMRVCLLRTGLVLGPNGGFLDRMLLPFRLGLGARLGDGRQWMSWIHRDDYVALLMQLLHDRRATGAFNMTSPEPVHNAAFTEALARCLQRPAFLAAPAPLLRLALGEMSGLLLGGQRALPTQAQALGFRFAHTGLSSALDSILRDTARSR